MLDDDTDSEFAPLPETGPTLAAPEGPTTTDGVSAQPLDVVFLPIDSIIPDPLNPNEESPTTFNTLVSTISEDGFDQPIVVCPIPDSERASLEAPPEAKYVLAKGEHRWRAGRVIGYQEIPAVIRPWDTLTRRTRLVRDNVVKGELNRQKFTELVENLQKDHRLDGEIAASLTGFESSKEMYSHMVRESKQKKLDDTAQVDAAKDKLKVLDDLALVLNAIFTKHGHTVPQGYIAFMFGGQMHYMVEMDKPLHDVMQQVHQLCQDRKVDMSIVLSSMLKDFLPPQGDKTE